MGQYHGDVPAWARREDDGTNEMGEPVDSVAVQAAKEVDSQRREVDEIAESMRGRQRYFYEKAQMFREAADHYTRMAEDIAELLNNDYLNKANKIQTGNGLSYGDGPVPR
jgi:acyl-CoA reductase-like NAD-dependent aldehyde dehydrogenase